MAPSLRVVDFDPLLDESSSSFGSSTTSSSSTLTNNNENNNENNNNNNKKRGRSVAFDKTVKVHTVPSRKQLSKQEMESLYMSPQDLLAIKRGLILRIRELEQQQGQTNTNDDNDNDDDNDDDDTLRGLEECRPQTAMERRRRIDSAVQMVLMRQALGKEDDDECSISESYGKFVRQSAFTAHLRGLQDERKSPYGYQSSPKQMAMMR
jgi:hypothetical protein